MGASGIAMKGVENQQYRRQTQVFGSINSKQQELAMREINRGCGSSAGLY